MPQVEHASPQRPTRFLDLIAPGLRALRENWRPFIAIQIVAALLVGAFYVFPRVAEVYGSIAAFRERGGLLFVVISTIIAGAFLPEIAKRLTKPGYRFDGAKAREMLFLMGFFSLNGLLVDAFYWILGLLIGTGNDLQTIAIKVAIDQTIFSPMIALPYAAFAFDWRRRGFDLLGTVRQLGPRWYVRRVLVLQLPGWAYWAPMVIFIYALPVSLQFVLWLLAMAAWSLVMVFINTEPEESPIPPPE